MMRLFIIEWLYEYLNTPKIEMTTTIELLGILSIGIIAFAVLGLITGVWLIIDFIRSKLK